MSWLNDLYQTYQNHLGLVASNLDSGVVLLPIAHSTQNANIEISIDDKGNCLWASRIPKSESVTIIPVTEDSATRSSGISPHPLDDKLVYLAGDYQAFTGYDNEKEFQAYLSLLSEWCEHPEVLPKVLAIKNYVSRRCIMHDLVEQGCLTVNDGKLDVSKYEGIAQEDFFVRFSVQLLSEDISEEESRVYRDINIFHSYEKFYLDSLRARGTDLCYATGEQTACSEKHPSKIRNTGDKAKLISANDTSGFTYRGRFSNSAQVASIGYEVSQKAHNALRWLIAKQGIYNGSQVFVAWEIGGKTLPKITEDTFSLLGDDENDEAIDKTNEPFTKRVKKAIKGYQEDLSKDAEVIVMGVEAATIGRLSVTYYKKMHGSEFIENVKYWHETCIWRHMYYNFPIGFVGAPSLARIAYSVYGKNNDTLTKSARERLIPCVIERQPIPRDIVETGVYRISNRMAFDSKTDFLNCLNVICALIRKYRYDRSVKNQYGEKEEWNVTVDESCLDRSYLFGQWLCAAQKVEEATFGEGDKGRATAAERYMQQFSKKPIETTKIIAECLQPYMLRLKGTPKYWLVIKLQEIMSKIEVNQYKNREPLTELYLLGYSHQMNDFYTKKLNNGSVTADSIEESENKSDEMKEEF